MVEWSNFINNVGFPIACTCGLAFILWQMWKQIKTTCDKLTETNEELVQTKIKKHLLLITNNLGQKS